MHIIKRGYWFIIIFAIACFPAIDVFAQDVAKTDTSKTGGKVSDFAQKQQENYQEVMNKISESQFATTVGNKIDAAKEGVKFAKENYNSAVGFVNDTKESILNSNEFAMAQKSKEIAEEKKALQDLESQKSSQLSELQANSDLEKATLEEKIKETQNNYDTKLAIYNQELAQASDEEEIKKIEEEIANLQTSQEAEMAEFEAELENTRVSHARYVEEDKAAENGDFATIDFSGSVDGVKFEGGSAEDL